jgi:hypothetical protein
VIRLPDWEQRFVAAMPVELAKPFAWGEADCVLLMAAAVRACHGDHHPVLKHLGGYKSKRSAVAKLKRLGGLSVILAKHFEEVPLLMAQTGDLGVLAGNGIEAGAVIIDGQAVGKGEDAPSFRLPVRSLTKVFRV